MLSPFIFSHCRLLYSGYESFKLVVRLGTILQLLCQYNETLLLTFVSVKEFNGSTTSMTRVEVLTVLTWSRRGRVLRVTSLCLTL